AAAARQLALAPGARSRAPRAAARRTRRPGRRGVAPRSRSRRRNLTKKPRGLAGRGVFVSPASPYRVGPVGLVEGGVGDEEGGVGLDDGPCVGPRNVPPRRFPMRSSRRRS